VGPSKEKDGDDLEKLNRGTRWRRLSARARARRGEKLAQILQKTTILKKSKFDF